MPVMCGMVHNLRDVARQADAETRRSGKSSDALDNCGTLMQSCFRTALQATGAPSSPCPACADGSEALARRLMGLHEGGLQLTMAAPASCPLQWASTRCLRTPCWLEHAPSQPSSPAEALPDDAEQHS